MITRRFSLWLAAVAMLALVYGFVVHGRMRFETDILAMLPQVERDPLVEDAVKALAEVTGRRVLFLVGAPDLPRAQAAAAALADTLERAGEFERVSFRVAFDAGAFDALYTPYRAVLLSDQHRRTLAGGHGSRLSQDALRSLYTPSGWLRARSFADDPLNLYGDFLMQQLPVTGAVQLQDDLLVAPSPQGPFVLVTAETATSAFSLATTARLEAVIASAIAVVQGAHPGSEVLCSAVVRHAAAASARSQAELATFGSVSLVAIVLLVVLTFRALRPLLLTLLALGTGTLAALTACHFLFERVHLVTLVFGSTLTGVGVDYSLHYFSDQFRQRGTWDPAGTLRHVGPAILIGMGATALGYVALLLLPFPGLRQMATFSIVGIAGACATVLLAYPMLANRASATHLPAALVFSRRLQTLPAARALPVPAPLVLVLLVALGALGAWGTNFVDDVRALQSAPAWLSQQDQRIRELLGGGQDTRFFVVEGADAEALLQGEEQLREGLDALVADGRLAGYQAVSRAVPSLARQARNHELLAQQVYGADGQLAVTLREVGYAAPEIARQRATFPAAPPRLEPATWLASPASAALRPLWLEPVAQRIGRGHASAVSLSGVQDRAALLALDQQLPAVQFVDRVAEISQFMERFRTLASLGLVAALIVIALVMQLRYGRVAGCRLMIAPVGGAAFTLATLALTGVDANLFNVLALLLVLGMGVDYAVFMREGREARATVIMAILLAALMTLLSFGLLALSTTPFIRSLGLTVVLGVSYTFVLALLSGGDDAGARWDNPAPSPSDPAP